MNFPIFGVKGRTPWVLNKAEARRKGRKNCRGGKPSQSLFQNSLLFRGTYNSKNGKNLHLACSSLLGDGGVLISKTQLSMQLFWLASTSPDEKWLTPCGLSSPSSLSKSRNFRRIPFKSENAVFTVPTESLRGDQAAVDSSSLKYPISPSRNSSQVATVSERRFLKSLNSSTIWTHHSL